MGLLCPFGLSTIIFKLTKHTLNNCVMLVSLYAFVPAKEQSETHAVGKFCAWSDLRLGQHCVTCLGIHYLLGSECAIVLRGQLLLCHPSSPSFLLGRMLGANANQEGGRLPVLICSAPLLKKDSHLLLLVFTCVTRGDMDPID